MNIYFACSITGGRQDELVYQAIVAALLEGEHQVPTAHLSRTDILAEELVIDPAEVYRRDVAWIEASDALIAEVSTPSHGVGYEIGFALGRGKPVLACARQGVRVSKMISGNRDPRLCLATYTGPEDAVRVVQAFLRTLEK